MKKLFLLMALATICISAVNAQNTLYVKPDAASNAWNGMSEMVYTNLQDAIDAAQAGDQIWVAAGTYVPTSNFPNGSENRCKSFVLKSGVAIYGGFAGTETDLSQRETEDLPFYFTNPTVLSGEISSTPTVFTDNAYHVVYAATASDFVLDGFTIMGGYGNRQAYNNEQRGAGVFMGGSTEPNHSTNSVVRNCLFYQNTANLNGGAAYVPYTNRIENCAFSNNSVVAANSGGGAVFFDNCSYLDTVALNCYFMDNSCAATSAVSASSRYGGGAVSSGNNCLFYQCTFIANSCTNPGGAAYFSNSNQFHYCIFVGNSATRGGALFGNTASSLLTSNCLILNNTASDEAGAIYTTGGSSRSVNCTFAGNTAPTNTVIGAGSGFTLFNSILWNNGSDANNLFTSNLNCQYSAVEGMLPAGNGNLNLATADFAFQSPSTLVGLPTDEDQLEAILMADFSLQGSSLCRDAGSTATLSLSGYQFPEVDFAGEPRINGALIDLGCYEIQCDDAELTFSINVIDTVYSSEIPGTGIIHIEIAIDNYNADNQYQITVQDADISEPMTNGSYTLSLNFPEVVTFTIVRTDEIGCTYSVDSTIDTYNDSIFNGIHENGLANVVVYPNPAGNQVTVQCLSSYEGGEWQLFDLNGRCILSQTVTTETMTLNLTQCPAGVYLLRRVNGDGKVLGTTRLIKR